MPITKEREYRTISALECRLSNSVEKTYIVEGYASTFEPYSMGSYKEYECIEQIDSRAFDEADLTDVIMQYDHSGKVYARQSNGTLEIEADEKGLKIRADLSTTPASRELYEEIRSGLITKMSFGFTVEDDEWETRGNQEIRTITKIKKVYDVSAVSIPANPDTNLTIKTRSLFEGAIEEELMEHQKRERRAKALQVKIKAMKEK